MLDKNKPRNMYGKCACACCGNFTVSAIFDICPVCFWEENWYQEEHDTSDSGGPNRVSIVEARENYKNFGACEVGFLHLIRPVLPEELVD